MDNGFPNNSITVMYCFSISQCLLWRLFLIPRTEKLVRDCSDYFDCSVIKDCTLQNAPLERPACFAFPERNSSWNKYYQPSGYRYFTNEPVLLNMLRMPGVM